mgnify:CR=1 FL=1
MHEWALLIFTICLQAAIGGALMLTIFYKKISTLDAKKSFQAMKLPLIAVAVLTVVGLGASFAHLGTPTNALNTLRNFGSSWMSREIVFTGLFIIAVFVTLGLALAKKKVSFPALLITSIIGLIDIFCMASIYTNSLVSGWNSVNTFTSFYGSALIIGPVLVVSLMVPVLRDEKFENLSQSLVKYAFYLSIIGIAVQLVGLAVFAASIPEITMIGATDALTILDGYQSTVVARWIIELIGAGILGYLALSYNRKAASLAIVSLLALITAEGMSRYLFFLLGA